MQIGDKIQRKDPQGNIVIRDILTEEDLAYHTDLATQGYEYKVIGKANQAIDPGAKVCISCEG